MENLLPSELKRCVGDTAQEFRLKRKSTQEKLAAEMDVRQSFVSKTENGDRHLRLVDLPDYCRVLKVSPKKFVERVEEKWAAAAREGRKPPGAGPRPR